MNELGNMSELRDVQNVSHIESIYNDSERPEHNSFNLTDNHFSDLKSTYNDSERPGQNTFDLRDGQFIDDRRTFKETDNISTSDINSSSFDSISNMDLKINDIGTTSAERIEFASYSNGEWSGEPGNSTFTPNSEIALKELKEYNQDGIEYKDGNPDFSKCSEATIKINNMTSDRPNNFRQADMVCAEKWNAELRDGRNDWTARDIKGWRQENRYSWHERIDMKTMDLVQRDIHEECKHYGGVAECKRYETANVYGGKFDD